VAGAATAALGAQALPGPPRPELALSATVIDLARIPQHGQSPERRIRIGNAGGGDLNAWAATSASWLKLHLAGDELVIAADTNAAGEYEGTVTVDSDGGIATIRVQAQVDPTPRPALWAAATTHPEPVPEIPAAARPGPQQEPALVMAALATAAAVAPVTETAPAPATRNDPGRATRVLSDAERIAQSITDEYEKAAVLASIAKALAATDPDRAERLAPTPRTLGVRSRPGCFLRDTANS
jgi:hypothetical protein